MTHIWTEEELKIKNGSCATCKNCKKIDARVYDNWLCEAPENKINSIDKVSGEFIRNYKTCRDARDRYQVFNGHMYLDILECPWHQPLFIYNRFGIADYSLGSTSHSTPSLRQRIQLKNTTVDDI